MDKVEEFKKSIKQASDEFKEIPKTKVKLVSHLDCDGITACSIIVKVLNDLNLEYDISIVQQIDPISLQDIVNDDSDFYIFSDLGSGQFDLIKKIIKKPVLILDHHELDNVTEADNIIHVNPHLQDIDGSLNISGAGVSYLFAKSINESNKKLAHIAIIGAIGDIQEDQGFKELNNEILEDAVTEGTIEVKKALRIYGKNTRPLFRALQYTSDPFIPDVSNSESGSIQFLQELGINLKQGNKWRLFTELNQEELQRLSAGIIMRRSNQDNPEDIFGCDYLLIKEDIPILKDVKEFSSLINACGRLGKASVGIGICLGDNDLKKKAMPTYTEYKRNLVAYLRWFEENRENFISGNNYIIVNSKDYVRYTMIGTIMSILAKGTEIEPGTILLALSRMPYNKTKISIRISQISNNKENKINLKEIIDKIVNISGGQAGGHKDAAGAIIDTSTEQDFIKAAQEILERNNTK